MRRGLAGFALLALAAAALTACASRPAPEPRERTEPPPSYGEVVERYNARASRLDTLWARAIVAMRYTDRDGDVQKEQGEGHLQVIQPSRLALSAGKLGEVYFWLGADEERYWFFELLEETRASVGRHENVGKPCNAALGVPVHPLDLVDLLAITTLPEASAFSGAGVRAPDPIWSPDGRSIVVDVPARLGVRRLFLDPESLHATRVELWGVGRAAPAVVATLTHYERVDVPSEPGMDPRTASRVEIVHRESESRVTLFLKGMNDGSRRDRLSDEAFSFESLLESFAPETVVALDADCERPALATAP